jgi:hypothetical protein
MHARTRMTVSIAGGALVWWGAAQRPDFTPRRRAVEPARATSAAVGHIAERVASAAPVAAPVSAPAAAPAPAQALARSDVRATPPPLRPSSGRPALAVETSETTGSDAEASVEDEAVVRERLLSTWSLEPDDDDWSAELTGYLSSAFIDLCHGGHVSEVACRATLCRAQLHFDSMAEVAKFGADVGTPDGPRRVFMRVADGGVEVEVFVPRSPAGTVAR